MLSPQESIACDCIMVPPRPMDESAFKHLFIGVLAGVL